MQRYERVKIERAKMDQQTPISRRGADVDPPGAARCPMPDMRGGMASGTEAGRALVALSQRL